MQEITEKSILNKAKIEYIIIAICTYKRPKKLERLLNNLCNLSYPEIKTSVLVTDNDIEQSAKEIYEKFADKLHILYCNEPKKGFTNVRNKALKEAIELGASHLAFIDDDEIADVNWLINHIKFYDKFENIYISSGPTYKKFNKEYPNYIKNNKTFKVYSHKKLGQIKKSCASGNVFFPLDIVKNNNIYFSDLFNESGSEDIDFFSRLYQRGFLIGWNLNAINYEIIEDERANIKWIISRAFHDGCCIGIEKSMNNKNKFKRFVYQAEKLITILFNVLIIPFSLIKGLTGLTNALIRLFKNFGKLVGTVIVLLNLKPIKRGIV